MPFTVTLTHESLNAAKMTAAMRPVMINHHNPSEDSDADLFGAMAEHAFAQHLGIPQSSIDYSGGRDGRGDGGVDFNVHGTTVDVKSSARHPSSWVIPGGSLKSEWYVFATVSPPDMVTFKAKGHRDYLSKVATRQFGEKRKRLVHLQELDDIGPEDFTRKPSRKGIHRGHAKPRLPDAGVRTERGV